MGKVSNEKKLKKNKKARNKKIKTSILTLVYVITLLVITTPIVLLVGPYSKTRKMFISTLLATRHAYLLTDYLSEDTLKEMQGIEDKEIENESTAEQDLGKIEVKCTSGNDIKRFNITNSKYDGYLLEIKNPLSVKVAMTNELGVVGEKTSEMAKNNNAIAAINGGAFAGSSTDGVEWAGTGATPSGFVVSDGKVIYNDCGEDSLQNVTAITDEGKLIVGSYTLKQLQEKGVKEAMCFTKEEAPFIISGERQITDKYEGGYNPRTAIGQKADGTIVFLVTDGRTIAKPGSTRYDIQEIMLKHGVENAGALDGGYSSTMYYKGKVINSPNSWTGERTVATAYYVEG
ncbi:MAG: phosphodiester glycosidase family protein [Clostridiaceae bacterium]|nr:phosphodiester glycosidase family protein [Clostridiaceae bacterium]